jgi:hypothetical protein
LPLDFTFLPFDHRQRKISGDKSERLPTEIRYSPYRRAAALGFDVSPSLAPA